MLHFVTKSAYQNLFIPNPHILQISFASNCGSVIWEDTLNLLTYFRSHLPETIVSVHEWKICRTFSFCLQNRAYHKSPNRPATIFNRKMIRKSQWSRVYRPRKRRFYPLRLGITKLIAMMCSQPLIKLFCFVWGHEKFLDLCQPFICYSLEFYECARIVRNPQHWAENTYADNRLWSWKFIR